ncbi:hypothetical protein MNBD_BACTEROID01-130 [hydrothermal vent metagenome]|uniref:CAAX prenyl protease 2/Lysostaphin resistance protein A-like domain-containing protein n=1 Tax=hydrothermal vent metagenome TaxID=652676 RepID=A0A3B0T2P6_9ZZZZ
MPVTAFRGMRPSSQLLFSIIVIIICFLFFLFIAVVIAIPVFKIDSLSNLPNINNLSDPNSIRVLKFFQVMQSIGIFIVPPAIIGWLFHGKIATYLMLNRKVVFSSVFLVIILTVFVNPAINYIGALNAKMAFPGWLSGVEEWMRRNEDNATLLTEAFLNVHTMGGLLFNLFMIAFLPAIGEELLFRGVVQRIFTDLAKSPHWGIWISAILFSALHMQFYGFMPRLLLGVIFGYLLVWGGSLWLPIIAHFVNNGVAVVAMWLIGQGKVDPSIEEIGATPDSFYMAIISLALTLLILWLIKRSSYPGKNPGILKFK